MEITRSSRISFPQEARGEISNLLSMLDAFNHRNKNQHRLSPWWSRFNVLRRALRALVTTNSRGSHNTSVANSILVSYTDINWLKSAVIPRCYLSFSQLAADSQHATLGLMLLVVIARANRIMDDLLPLPENEPILAPPTTKVGTPAQSTCDAKQTNSDKGVKIQRNGSEKSRVIATTTESTSQAVKRGSVPIEASNKKKKKKKSKDEFSSLFGSLA